MPHKTERERERERCNSCSSSSRTGSGGVRFCLECFISVSVLCVHAYVCACARARVCVCVLEHSKLGPRPLSCTTSVLLIMSYDITTQFRLRLPLWRGGYMCVKVVRGSERRVIVRQSMTK